MCSNWRVLSILASSSPTFRAPTIAILICSSRRRICIIRRTPYEPKPPAMLNSVGLPMPTAVAPRARALMISVPRRIPPSTKTCICPPRICGANRLISRRVSKGGCAVSWERPPWLERTMPSTLCSNANAASSWHWIPLMTMGNFVMCLNQSTIPQSNPGQLRQRCNFSVRGFPQPRACRTNTRPGRQTRRTSS